MSQDHSAKHKSGLSLKELSYAQIGLLLAILGLVGFSMWDTFFPKPPPPLSEQIKQLRTVQKGMFEELQKVKVEANTK